MRMPICPKRDVVRGVYVAFALATLPMPLHAQEYSRIAPHEPKPQAIPTVTPPPVTKAAPASHSVIIRKLKGLVFLPQSDEVQSAGISARQVDPAGITATGIPLLEERSFTSQMRPYVGHPLTLAALQEITNKTTEWFRKHGRPFVSVTVPPQNITSGVVQIVVVEYRVGTINTAGNKWFSSTLLEGESDIKPGQALNLQDLQDDLAWLNGNPFRTVNTIFRPGRVPGTTDVTLQTVDRPPFRIYGTYDNQGAPSLGRNEWGVGATWGNVAGLDQTLSYQFTRSFSGRYNAHALSWTIPLPWRDKLLVFGSYATETPDIGPDFGESGHSGQASIRYVHQLPTYRFGSDMDFSQDIQFGYDFKSTNNNLEFGGQRIFGSKVEINQFPLIYDATLTDPYGQTTFQNQFVFSPGGITGGDNDKAYSTAVFGARSAYVYDTIGLTRTTFLPHGFTWTSRALGQFANHNLMYSEQLGLGGMTSVRGYYTDTVVGSQGFVISQELRAPAFSLDGLLHLNVGGKDRAQVGLFWDYGHISQVDPVPDAINHADIASLGVDFHASIGNNLDLAFDTGYKLRSVPGVAGRGSFVDIALTSGF